MVLGGASGFLGWLCNSHDVPDWHQDVESAGMTTESSMAKPLSAHTSRACSGIAAKIPQLFGKLQERRTAQTVGLERVSATRLKFKSHAKDTRQGRRA